MKAQSSKHKPSSRENHPDYLQKDVDELKSMVK